MLHSKRALHYMTGGATEVGGKKQSTMVNQRSKLSERQMILQRYLHSTAAPPCRRPSLQTLDFTSRGSSNPAKCTQATTLRTVQRAKNSQEEQSKNMNVSSVECLGQSRQPSRIGFGDYNPTRSMTTAVHHHYRHHSRIAVAADGQMLMPTVKS